jgi:hypothetical protein
MDVSEGSGPPERYGERKGRHRDLRAGHAESREETPILGIFYRLSKSTASVTRALLAYSGPLLPAIVVDGFLCPPMQYLLTVVVLYNIDLSAVLPFLRIK